jgi:uncharacterized protein
VLSVGDPLRQQLDVPECLRLLGTTAIGRLGFSEAALPALQPVTYRLAHGVVLIPAAPAGRTARAIRDGIVVLGVDSFGTCLGEWWVVNVVGPIHLVDAGSLLLEPVLVTGWRRAEAGCSPVC